MANNFESGDVDAPDGDECSLDSDCVPKICCHAASCVSVDDAPDCSNLFCTDECVEGSLDCGQGSCECVNGVCEGVFVVG